MAEQQEEIIIIDEADAAGIEHARDVSHITKPANNVKTILIGAIGFLIVLLIVILVVAIMSPDEKPVKTMNIEEIETKFKEEAATVVPEGSRLEKMIAKALLHMQRFDHQIA